MTEGGIEAKNISVEKLLSDFYIIPAYQREYVWQSSPPPHSRPEDVDRLLIDSFEAYENDPEAGYFIGSFVVCKSSDDFEVIDGQQRLTTLFALLCAARFHLEQDLQDKPWTFLHDRLEGASAEKDDEKDLRIEVLYPEGKSTLEAIRYVRDLPAKKEQSDSTRNIVAAYQTCLRFLKERCLGEKAKVREFVTWLCKKVNVVRIDTGDRAKALKVFETVNARGRYLNSMDLLKNLLFMNVEGKEDYKTLSDHWTSFVGTLQESKEKPLRFLRYYVLAKHNAGSVSEDGLFEWFSRTENRKLYEANPVKFVQAMKGSASNYISFSRGLDVQKRQIESLRNIQLLSQGRAKQHLILLLAAEKLPVDVFKNLCDEIEKTILCLSLARENTNKLDQLFARWAEEVKDLNASHFHDFVAKRVYPERNELKAKVLSALRTFGASKLSEGTKRYFLARIAEEVSKFEGVSKRRSSKVEEYMGLQIEHIMPQTPKAEAIDEFGEGDSWGEYVYRLGNLTFWNTENQSARNDPFSAKKSKYLSSGVLLTKLLALPDSSTGANTQMSKIATRLKPYETWNAGTLAEREEAMINIALEICGLTSSGS